MRWRDIDLRPSPQMLRQFATAFLVVVGGLAAWGAWTHGPTLVNVVVGAVAVVVGITGFIAPTAVRPIYVAAVVVTFPIGWVISNLILLLLFFGLFTPLAVWFRLTGRDALRLCKPDAGSYWLSRETRVELRRYTRQY